MPRCEKCGGTTNWDVYDPENDVIEVHCACGYFWLRPVIWDMSQRGRLPILRHALSQRGVKTDPWGRGRELQRAIDEIEGEQKVRVPTGQAEHEPDIPVRLSWLKRLVRWVTRD